jgi:hypothetical protein
MNFCARYFQWGEAWDKRARTFENQEGLTKRGAGSTIKKSKVIYGKLFKDSSMLTITSWVED